MVGRLRVARTTAALLLVAGCLATVTMGAAPDPGVSLTGGGSATSDAERRGQQALASLRYPWRELGYAIAFREYSGGRLGSANSRTKRIVIYVKRSQDQQDLRITIAHELGHALDFEHATASRRSEYRRIRRLDQKARWYPCDGCTDYRSHAGDWAEVFAYWLAGSGDFRSQVAGPPDHDQLRRLEPLFRVPRPQAAPPPSRARPSPSPSPSPSPEPLPVHVVVTPEPRRAQAPPERVTSPHEEHLPLPLVPDLPPLPDQELPPLDLEHAGRS